MAGNANVPILALNTPPELTRKIARGEPLTAQERAMIPTGFVATEGGYKNFVAMMGDHPGLNETDCVYFLLPKTLGSDNGRPDTGFERRNPEVQLLVWTGRGHVSGGYGITFYVRQKAHLKQLIILPREKRIGVSAWGF